MVSPTLRQGSGSRASAWFSAVASNEPSRVCCGCLARAAEGLASPFPGKGSVLDRWSASRGRAGALSAASPILPLCRDMYSRAAANSPCSPRLAGVHPPLWCVALGYGYLTRNPKRCRPDDRDSRPRGLGHDADEACRGERFGVHGSSATSARRCRLGLGGAARENVLPGGEPREGVGGRGFCPKSTRCVPGS